MPRVTQEEFLARVKRLNPGVKVLGAYTYQNVPVKTKCVKHGRVWNALPSVLYKGCGCQECMNEKISKANKLPDSEYLERLRTNNPNIKLVGPYLGQLKKTAHKCLKCKHTWDTYPCHVGRGISGCPVCHGEQSFATKKTKIQGKVIYYQGYEDRALRWIIREKKLNIKQIQLSKVGEVPTVKYQMGDQTHLYFPDFYVPKLNRIVEVKSKYTLFKDRFALRRNQAKAKACLAAGYKFSLLLVHDDRDSCILLPKAWLTATVKQLNFLCDDLR